MSLNVNPSSSRSSENSNTAPVVEATYTPPSPRISAQEPAPVDTIETSDIAPPANSGSTTSTNSNPSAEETKPSRWKAFKACFKKGAAKVKAWFQRLGQAIAAAFKKLLSCGKGTKAHTVVDHLKSLKATVRKLVRYKEHCAASRELYADGLRTISELPIQIDAKDALKDGLSYINKTTNAEKTEKFARFIEEIDVLIARVQSK